jgi:hypothetical protein
LVVPLKRFAREGAFGRAEVDLIQQQNDLREEAPGALLHTARLLLECVVQVAEVLHEIRRHVTLGLRRGVEELPSKVAHGIAVLIGGLPKQHSVSCHTKRRGAVVMSKEDEAYKHPCERARTSQPTQMIRIFKFGTIAIHFVEMKYIVLTLFHILRNLRNMPETHL